MKRKNEMVSVLGTALALALCLSGCGGAGDAPAGSQGGSSAKKNREHIRMEDLDWTVEERITDGERYAAMEYTNNSKYAVCGLEITFQERKDLTEEEKNKYLTDLRTAYELDDEIMEEMKKRPIGISAKSSAILEPGETESNVRCCYYNGYYYVKNWDHYQMVTPDIATIRYVDEEMIRTVYYDFLSGKYTEEDKSVPAYQWSETAMGELIPRPDAKIVESSWTRNEDSFHFEARGFTWQQYKDYVDACRAMGFTLDENVSDTHFSADNEQGADVWLSYDEENQEMSCMLHGPDEAPEQSSSSSAA